MTENGKLSLRENTEDEASYFLSQHSNPFATLPSQGTQGRGHTPHPLTDFHYKSLRPQYDVNKCHHRWSAYDHNFPITLSFYQDNQKRINKQRPLESKRSGSQSQLHVRIPWVLSNHKYKCTPRPHPRSWESPSLKRGPGVSAPGQQNSFLSAWEREILK